MKFNEINVLVAVDRSPGLDIRYEAQDREMGISDADIDIPIHSFTEYNGNKRRDAQREERPVKAL